MKTEISACKISFRKKNGKNKRSDSEHILCPTSFLKSIFYMVYTEASVVWILTNRSLCRIF